MPELRRDPIVGRWVIIATERARKPSDFAAPAPARRRPASAPSARATRTRPRGRSTSPAARPRTPANEPGLEGAGGAQPLPGPQDRGGPRPQGRGDLRPHERRGRPRGGHRDPRARPRSHEGPHRPARSPRCSSPSRRACSTCATTCASATSCSSRTRGRRPAPRWSTRTPSSSPCPSTPRQVQDEIDGARRHFEHRERCIFCDIVTQERKERSRLVFENEEFVVFAPWAPRSPFETWIVPKRHESNYEAEPKERLGQCAQALRQHAAAPLGGAGRPALQLHGPHQPAARPADALLPLAHRDHAGAHPGGRLRVGLGLPHQPGPARGGGRVPPQGGRARRSGAWSILFVASEVAPALQDRGAGRRGGRAAGGPGGARPRGGGGLAALRLHRPGRSTASRRATGRCGCAAPSRPPSSCAGGAASPSYLVEHLHYFGHRRGLYGDGPQEYGDNAERFTYLCRAALEVPARLRPPPAHPPPQRLADRPGRLAAPPRARRRPGPRAGSASVFTIHNLAYQGVFRKEVLPALGLPWEVFRFDAMEFHDRLNFLKAGLVFSDAITTVSPDLRPGDRHRRGRLGARRPAPPAPPRPPRHPERHRHRRVEPGRRPPPARSPTTRAHLSGKRACKAALQEELGLPVREDVPLVRMVGRLADQKGMDLVLAGAAPRCSGATCSSRCWGAGGTTGSTPSPRRPAGTATGWRCASASTRGWPTASRRAATSSSCRAASSPAA